MAEFLKCILAARESISGRMLLAAVIYAAMIALILIFLNGHGEFIYETF